MDELNNLGTEIGELLAEKAMREFDLYCINQDIENLEIAITPASGWEGSNAENRKTAGKKAILDDEGLKLLREERREIEGKIAEIESKLAFKTSRRRSIEWGIRKELTTALVKKFNTMPNGSVEYSDSYAFDKAADDHQFWGEEPF